MHRSFFYNLILKKVHDLPVVSFFQQEQQQDNKSEKTGKYLNCRFNDFSIFVWYSCSWNEKRTNDPERTECGYRMSVKQNEDTHF